MNHLLPNNGERVKWRFRLKYDVQIPFRRNEFISKWSELYRANAPQNRSLLKVDNFTTENYTKELHVPDNHKDT
jgi:hypothetical protein